LILYIASKKIQLTLSFNSKEEPDPPAIDKPSFHDKLRQHLTKRVSTNRPSPALQTSQITIYHHQTLNQQIHNCLSFKELAKLLMEFHGSAIFHVLFWEWTGGHNTCPLRRS